MERAGGAGSRREEEWRLNGVYQTGLKSAGHHIVLGGCYLVVGVMLYLVFCVAV